MPIAYSLDLRQRVISLCKQYSKEEVAEMLDIHAATVYRYLKRFIEDDTCIVPLTSLLLKMLKYNNKEAIINQKLLWDKFYINAPELRTQLEKKYKTLKRMSIF